ncbi:hypothetical protein L2755_01925 [Shewanella abyssi]|uniref:hypothetical protein n=1 Tax=Shewanella abyssi TaxID=311789 RepID=UPI00200E506B|nr:hypothetical protein [Shewanella abyssi]MCL1048390.1 hypothetical protein [Shewanella abyssi]
MERFESKLMLFLSALLPMNRVLLPIRSPTAKEWHTKWIVNGEQSLRLKLD